MTAQKYYTTNDKKKKTSTRVNGVSQNFYIFTTLYKICKRLQLAKTDENTPCDISRD